VPEQAPDHPANVDVPSGVAVRLTAVPASRFALQVVPQSMPPTLLVTVPPPVPAFVTVRAYCLFANVAVTDFADVIDTVQVPVPVHAPDHPLNVDTPSAAAVSTTVVPES
jgi:hypothetical protein